MRVLALTKYGPRAASTRQRFLLYEPYLNEHNIHLDLSPLIDNVQLKRTMTGERTGSGAAFKAYIRRLKALLASRSYDVLWIHYEVFPYLPAFFEKLIFLAGVPVVLDYDDAIFHMYDNHPNRMVRLMLSHKLAPLLRGAAASMCGNEYLREYAARFCREAVLVPTVVDTDRFVPLEQHHTNAPVVGWIGSPSTWKNVVPLLDTILSECRAVGATFRVVGAGPQSKGIAGVQAVDWTEAGELTDLQGFDIGIMPLLDLPFERGKCGYKLIQYMACGLPVVGSPVGVNSKIIDHSGNGYLAASEKEWQTALRFLLIDHAKRADFGRRGRVRCVERYSLAANAPIVCSTLHRAAVTRAH